jgi:hypothetical protein
MRSYRKIYLSQDELKNQSKGNTSFIFPIIYTKFGPLLHIPVSSPKIKTKLSLWLQHETLFGVRADASVGPQVDFSLSSPIFWTREYFLHDDLKQPGGQESGQEKQQGIGPCTFFSKK